MIDGVCPSLHWLFKGRGLLFYTTTSGFLNLVPADKLALVHSYFGERFVCQPRVNKVLEENVTPRLNPSI